ncbi:hypothetical protein GCM10009801_73200 [Streptomyces albiaxialis]|uniref:Uncharacterized protein n=1 Tax=Streptomyces albiaxialis TaxID=329523 RepID=A0ABP5IHF8_9ACTN
MSHLSLHSTPVDGAPAWLHKGAVVYDHRLKRWGVVVDVGFPGNEARQAKRAWLRPEGGGREWNPPIEDLRQEAPDPFEDWSDE